MRRRARRFVAEASLGRWIFTTAVANLFAALITAILVEVLVDEKNWWHRIGYLLICVILIGGSAALTGIGTKIRDTRFPVNASIILSMIRAISATARRENELRSSLRENSTDAERRRVLLSALKMYMSELEEVISNGWSTHRFGETTPVEVVLMKRASDGGVTVACWATTRPTSLDQRTIRRDFYDGTEAAKLYRRFVDKGTRSPLHLIEDISTYSEYDHFGRDPSLRSNSTALLPVYDSHSRCHGFVAITARNRAGMFREEDREFWIELWQLWEAHIVRCIVEFEATGQMLDEEQISV
ncbi:hypothetical protein Q3V37_25740 [Micromonospora profundi]|uniref:Uncharacterized protein n=1 Tax=Micromonospora profundi TaxID=1420889 RepID=A0AAJ6L298_9ACTN|nr:hypothetical protein [Micromonospora profundi]WLS44756.1 hypothetical protein Q3V37_25740 [Micromonospora profundi]